MTQRGEYAKHHGAPERYTGTFIEVHKTAAACLLKREGDDDDAAEWVPFSQIDRIVRTPGVAVVEVTMAAWIAKRCGFID